MTDRISEIKERRAKATPGEWKHFPDDKIPDDVRVCIAENNKCVCCLALMGNSGDSECTQQWNNDAEFIAAAPADIDYLLAEITAMQTELAQLREAQRWIPVEESLPEKSQNCLCRFNDDSIALCWSNGTPYKFHPDVTHWRELPAPPANGGGKE